LYVPRKQGGRGLRQLEKSCVGEITKLVEIVDRKEEPLLQIVRLHQHINSAMSQTAGRLKGELQRNKTNNRHHNKQAKRKMGREEDAWTIPKLLRRKAGGY
jgi:hypothetical protein